jgi:hypothetical protein
VRIAALAALPHLPSVWLQGEGVTGMATVVTWLLVGLAVIGLVLMHMAFNDGWKD